MEYNSKFSKDVLQTHKMPLISSALSVFQKATEDLFDLSSTLSSKKIRIYVRLMFWRIGEIDTLNEKYQAQASIESRWPIDINKLLPILSSDEYNCLVQGKSISLMRYSETNWHPQLYIENALSDIQEQIRYSAKVSKIDQQVYIWEHRDIKGLFWEKLELQHFPCDVQDLSISISSMFYDDKVLLVADPHYLSGINRETFIDQQEWSLYEHVDTQQRSVKEFLFRDDDEDDDSTFSAVNKERSRSILTITCHAARRANYFFWNGYCLIFLITLVAFCTFAIPPHMSANRLQISCTLLLTSITFRWTVNRSLPTISYLTTMDKYAIMCLFILVIISVWHGIIGGLIFIYTPDFRVTPTTWFVYIDFFVLYLSIGVYILIHFILLIWLFYNPLKCRRDLQKKDIDYRQLVSKKKYRKTSNNNPISIEN